MVFCCSSSVSQIKSAMPTHSEKGESFRALSWLGRFVPLTAQEYSGYSRHQAINLPVENLDADSANRFH